MRELPAWFRQDLPDAPAMARMRALLQERSLHTVCQGARCPNTGRCWSKGAVTFMILGESCTRSCLFCAVMNGRSQAPDLSEPERVAAAVRDLGLSYVVITSVTRDDLPDEGAKHFARTVAAIRQAAPGVKVELLLPDFSGRRECFEAVAASRPDVMGHNIETVRRLSLQLRPQAGHDRSLEALRLAKSLNVSYVKSGLMVGLGERDEEVLEALRELKEAGCDIVTIGQYLAPASDVPRWPVARFVPPETFAMYAREGASMGLAQVFSGPLVRSSFMAERVHAKTLEGVSI